MKLWLRWSHFIWCPVLRARVDVGAAGGPCSRVWVAARAPEVPTDPRCE